MAEKIDQRTFSYRPHQGGRYAVRVQAIDAMGHVGSPSKAASVEFVQNAPLARIQALFFRTPLVHAFIWGSATYHDQYWWPVHGRKRMKGIAGTPWGQLFESYE